MREEFELFKNAYKTYNLDIREDVSKNVLGYIRERLIANKDFLEQLIVVTKENITFEQILNVFDNIVEKKEIYKKEKKMKLNEFGFVSNIYSTSIGVIAVETAEPLCILKYFILAIKSRNAIIISDIEFSEESLKSAFLIIFSEALRKFKIDANIINILPFEECNYEWFDKIILADENEIIDVRKTSNEIFIYIEDTYFEEEAQKEISYLKQAGKNPIVIRNSFEDTIEKINKNKAYGACIYTRNPKLGYDFINLVKTDNAFVNSSIMSYGENLEKHCNPLYSNKKIMFELGIIKGEGIQNNNSSIDKVKNVLHSNVNNFQFDNHLENNIVNAEKNENQLSLVKIDTTPWYKKMLKKIAELKRRFLEEEIE